MSEIIQSYTGTLDNLNMSGLVFSLNMSGAQSTLEDHKFALRSITFSKPSSAGYEDPVYLNLWEMKEGENTYTYITSSTNASNTTTSSDGVWNFTGVELDIYSKYYITVTASPSSVMSELILVRSRVYSVPSGSGVGSHNYINNYNPPSLQFNWMPVMSLTLDETIEGSINISKGYYDSGSAKIIMPASTVSLTDLKSGETVGCKNKLFAYSKNNVAGVKITGDRLADISTAHDVSVDLNKPIYLDHTKEYIAGGAEIAPVWSFSNGGISTDYTLIGTPTIDSDYIASNFSSRNAVAATVTLDTSKPWELRTKITTGSNVSTRQKFVGGVNGVDCKVPTLEFRSSSVYVCIPNTSGNGWLAEVNTSYAVSSSTSYWFKYGWTGTTYFLQVSTDGTTYSSIYSWNSSTAAYHSDSYKVGFGNDLYMSNDQFPFYGSIDLKLCSFDIEGTLAWSAVFADEKKIMTQKSLVYDNVNDKTFWYPSETSVTLTDMKSEQTVGIKNNLYLTNTTGSPAASIIFCEDTPSSEHLNITVNGAPTISADKSVSGFTDSAYLSVPFTVPSTDGTTIITAISLTGSPADTEGFLGKSTGTPNVYVHPSSLKLGCYDGDYSQAGSTTMSANTKYWIGIRYYSSATQFFLLQDNNYTLDTLPAISNWNLEFWFSNKNEFGGSNIILGKLSGGLPFTVGTIYLEDTAILSGGTYVWKAVEAGQPIASYSQQPEYVWLNSSKDTILGVQEEPDEIVIEGGLWTQPMLSSNGTWGGTEFAVSSSTVLSSNSEAWKAFDGIPDTNSNDRWHSSSGHPAWIGWYNPEPLIITNIQVQNRGADGSFINSYDVSYSDDGSTWTVCASGTSPDQTDGAYWNIAISETTGHKYWKLISNSSSGSNNDYTAVGLITLTAYTNTLTVSDSHYWTYLKDSTYNCEGESLSISSMPGTALSGSLLAMPAGTLIYTENNYQGVLGDAFTGYTVTFTDTAHSSIASLTKTGTRCRCYSVYNGNVENPHYYSFYVTSLPVTGEIPMSMVGFLGEREITPSGSTSSYTYDAATDTITYSGYTASYVGDVYVNLGA